MNLANYQTPEVIRDALQARRIAVVGLSSNPARPSHDVAAFLQARGHEIVPVNPRETEVLGATSYPDLAAVPGGIDMVDVFRDSSAVPDIARAAVAVGARFLWLQLGVISREGVAIAEAGGVRCVVDRCPKIEYSRFGADTRP